MERVLIQPVHIDDLVRAYMECLNNKNHFYRSYNIGGSHPIENIELFKIILKLMKKKIILISFPPKVIKVIINFLSIFGVKIINHEQVDRFQENKNIDLEKFIEKFGFTPRSFEQGVKSQINEYRKI